MADFFGDLKSPYLFAEDKADFTGLLESTAIFGGADAVGRYAYNEFIGTHITAFVTKILGSTASKYVNVLSSGLFALAGNYIAAKYVDSSFWSKFIQAAASQPLGDYIAKALGDPMINTQSAGAQVSGAEPGMTSTEAQEQAEVLALMGAAPSVSMQSMRGFP